jgi:hypothetical protein
MRSITPAAEGAPSRPLAERTPRLTPLDPMTASGEGLSAEASFPSQQRKQAR